MEHKLSSKAWNPYIAGALTGVLMALSVLVADKYFGASTSYVRSAGMLENLFSAERVKSLAYFRETLPEVDWQWMFVAGILIGSLVSALLSGTFKIQFVPDMWKSRFGTTPIRRGAIAFCGALSARRQRPG